MPGFLKEVKKRKLWRVALTYPAAAFIVIEAVALFSDRFGWDERSLPFVLIILVGGFPLALIWNWFHGGKEQPYFKREKALYSSIVIFTIGFAFFYWVKGDLTNANQEQDAAAEETKSLSEVDSKRENSIAVLPLDNQSSNEENAFFTEGIHDGLLTSLSKVRKLLVLSRTSTLRYKDTKMLLPEIGRELGVTYIVEGGVQRSGDRIRINIQLIEATTDQHIWAETYDRSLSTANIFDIQSEIVLTIVEKLKTSITGEEQNSIVGLPTTNLEAYDLYLKARRNMELHTVPSLKKAKAQLEKAIALDNNFLEPKFEMIVLSDYDGESMLNGTLELYENDDSLISNLEDLIIANPKMEDALAYRGWLKYQINRDTLGANTDLLTALKINPNSHWANLLYGSFIRFTKSPREAEPVLLHAYKINPTSLDVLYHLTMNLTRQKKYNQALSWAKKVLVEDRNTGTEAIRLVYALKNVADTAAYLKYHFYKSDSYRMHQDYFHSITKLGAKSETLQYLHALDSIYPSDERVYELHFLFHLEQRELDKAEEWYSKIETTAPDVPISQSFYNLEYDHAVIQVVKGKKEAILDYSERNYPKIMNSPINNNPSNAINLGNYGIGLYESDEQEEGLKVIKRSIAILEAMEKKYSETANLSVFYGYTGEIKKSVKYIKEAIVLRRHWGHYYELLPGLERLRNSPEYKNWSSDYTAEQKVLRDNFRRMVADPNTLENILREIDEKY